MCKTINKIDIDLVTQIIANNVNAATIINELLEHLRSSFGGADFIDENRDKNLDYLLKSIDATKGNFYLEHPKFHRKNCLVVPAHFAGIRIGTLIISTEHSYAYTPRDIEQVKWISLIITNFITQLYQTESEHLKIAKNSISSLSYSELEAALYIFKEIKEEALIVLGKIADNNGLSRSVVGNALRKLESAGTIETRSLGVKGTNIKIVNKKLVEELGKIML